MLVSICGSQGAGKSTIINELANRGIPVISRKTSRSILDDWNVTLQEVNNNKSLTLDFQLEILKRKYEDEQFAIGNEKVWVTERSYADLFTYCLFTLGGDNQYSDFVDDYYIKCKEYQQQYIDIFYLGAGHFNPEHDGVRSTNQYFSTVVDLAMLKFTHQISQPNRMNLINTPNLADRVDIIYQSIQEIPY